MNISVQEKIDMLAIMYDKVEYAGNELVVGVNKLNNTIDIIELNSKIAIYKYDCTHYSINETFINIHISDYKGIALYDVISIETRKNILDNTGVCLIDKKVLNCNTKNDIIYLRIFDSGRAYGTLTYIYNKYFDIIYCEGETLGNMVVGTDIIKYDTNLKNGTYNIQKIIDKKTGQLLKKSKINRVELLKDKIKKTFNWGF